MNLSHLYKIREFELNQVMNLIPNHSHILEVGAGTGWQAKMLSENGHKVMAIDIEDYSTDKYKKNREWEIVNFNGTNIPFGDNSFDIVFSSNVLEHVKELEKLLKEMQRVLKPDGKCIHVLPSPSWRFWTNVSHYLKLKKFILTLYRNKSIIPVRHGERGNSLTELYFFSTKFWKKIFKQSGYSVLSVHKNHLFYTGNNFLGRVLNLKTRKYLSNILGSSCNIFLLKNS